jgi:hypothetical protein
MDITIALFRFWRNAGFSPSLSIYTNQFIVYRILLLLYLLLFKSVHKRIKYKKILKRHFRLLHSQLAPMNAVMVLNQINVLHYFKH